MKKLSVLVVIITSLFTSALLGQGGNPGNLRIPGAFLGWNGTGPAGSLDIRNDFAGQPIQFFTNGFMRMTILDGGAGPAAGFVGINCTSAGVNAPNQLFTVRGGNINLISPAGNTAYMLSSAANPNDRVLWHNGDRQDIFVGVLAGNAGNAAGTRSTFAGYRAGFSAANTLDCVFMGSNSGFSNTTGSWNVFVGSGTGIVNNASRNVFIGYQSGNSNTAGTNCVFVGYHAGRSNVAADFNTFVGHQAGLNNTTGQQNTFIGNNSAMQCVGGFANVAVGSNSGFELVSGIENVFVGASCAAINATGSQNVILGHDAAQNTPSVDMNVIIGEEAYASPTAIGDANVIMGWRASNLMQVGRDNVMIGHRVNSLTAAGDDNIFIGHLSGASVANLSNSVAFGSNALVRSSNKMILGDNSMNVGIGLSDDNVQQGPQNKLEINTNLMAAEPNLAASGLRFRDLTSASPTTANPGTGVLAVDSNGDVIYVPENAFAFAGVCSNPAAVAAAALTDDNEVPLNGFNFYYSGQAAGADNMAIGLQCGNAILGKLHVQRDYPGSSAYTNSTGIYVLNNDISQPGINLGTAYGVYSVVDNTNRNNIGGFFNPSNGQSNTGVQVLVTSASPNSNIGVESNISGATGPNVGVSASVTGTSGAGNTAGQFSITSSTAVNRGIFVTASGATTSNIGGVFSAVGTSSITNIAIRAIAQSATGNNYALVADGDIFVNSSTNSSSGYVVASDAMFKENVDTISDALSAIMQLTPRTYNYDTTNSYGMNFDSHSHYGFIAQEIETIIPSVVGSATKPAEYDSLGNQIVAALPFKTVNYNDMIALLTKAIQEQQHQIDSINTVIGAMQSQINGCCSSGRMANENVNQTDVHLSNSQSIVLNQNVPNPFAEQTTISYLLPESVVIAQMLFYDAQGKLIKVVDLEGRGAGQLNVFADDLSGGIYSYALVTDGQIIDTKQMVKAK